MLDRAARELGADEGLDHVEQVVVAEECEGFLAAQPHDIQFGIDLVTLTRDEGQPPVEGRLGMNVGDLGLRLQLAGAPFDVCLVLLDHGVQVSVAKSLAHDEETLLLKPIYLFCGQFHRLASLSSLRG